MFISSDPRKPARRPTPLRSSSSCLVLAALLACTSKPAAAPPSSPPAAAPVQASCPAASVKARLTAAQAVTEAVAIINAADAPALHARFSPELQQLASPDDLRRLLTGMLAARGKLTGAVTIAATEREGTFQLIAERGAWKLQVALRDDDIFAGFGIEEPDPAPPPVARSVPVGLPFRDEWLVFWGGDRPEINQHVAVPSQRRAADLIKVDATGKSHRGAGRELTDYYAYGQDVLAMTDGVVVTAIDGVPDSVPGTLNPYVATGNLVVVRHAGDLHSAYAHLVPGSLKIKPGDRVRRGQVLGACGNSGNSSEPHLHVQLMDGPRLEASWGLEPVFAEALVVRDGAATTRADYTFIKGDRVSPPRPAKRG